MERHHGAAHADRAPVAGKGELAGGVPVRPLRVEVHEPDRLLGGAAAGAGDAGDRNGDVGAEPFARPARHRLRHLGRHSAVRGEELLLHAERRLLHLVRVRDDAAHEYVARAGYRGETLRDHPTRLGLSGRQA